MMTGKLWLFNATALKWAMLSWTKNATVSPSGYDRMRDCHNYPVVLGEDSGTLADGVIAGVDDLVRDA